MGWYGIWVNSVFYRGWGGDRLSIGTVNTEGKTLLGTREGAGWKPGRPTPEWQSLQPYRATTRGPARSASLLGSLLLRTVCSQLLHHCKAFFGGGSWEHLKARIIFLKHHFAPVGSLLKTFSGSPDLKNPAQLLQWDLFQWPRPSSTSRKRLSPDQNHSTTLCLSGSNFLNLFQ